MPGFKPPDELLAAVPPERLEERRRLLEHLNASASPGAGNGTTSGWQDLHRRACALANGGGQGLPAGDRPRPRRGPLLRRPPRRELLPRRPRPRRAEGVVAPACPGR